MDKIKHLYTCGDIHGNFKLISHKIKSLKITDSVIIQVGDFGVGFNYKKFEKEDLDFLDKVLKDTNCILYAIRGNHDKPELFDGKWSNQFDNINLLPDYSIIEVNGENILLAGGAISIDRNDRKIKMMQSIENYHIFLELYWANEIFVLNEDKLKSMRNIDYVITHSCPKMCQPINNFENIPYSHGNLVEYFAKKGDGHLKQDLNSERIDLQKMYDILKENNNIKKWFYGHFHSSNKETINNTEFITLDIDEFYKIKLN